MKWGNCISVDNSFRNSRTTLRGRRHSSHSLLLPFLFGVFVSIWKNSGARTLAPSIIIIIIIIIAIVILVVASTASMFAFLMRHTAYQLRVDDRCHQVRVYSIRAHDTSTANRLFLSLFSIFIYAMSIRTIRIVVKTTRSLCLTNRWTAISFSNSHQNTDDHFHLLLLFL